MRALERSTHALKSNSGKRTYEGVDVCGLRAFHEVRAVLAAHQDPPIGAISFVGHSLGGLIARHAIGLLEEHGVLAGLRCMTYCSIVSPHCGSRRHSLGRTFSKLASWAAPKVFGRSGEQLMLTDADRLLVAMTAQDSVYMRGLARFERRVAYAALTDPVVHFSTASIVPFNPYRRFGVTQPRTLPAYPHVIDPELTREVHARIAVVPPAPDAGAPAGAAAPPLVAGTVHAADTAAHADAAGVAGVVAYFASEPGVYQALLHTIVHNLNTLRWERVDVTFTGLSRVLTHGFMVVKKPSRHSAGADVVAHVRDHFVLW